jgi:hypothetical protein
MVKHSNIFIEKQGALKVFLWANVGKDGSVMIGIPGEIKSYIELIIDHDKEYRPEELYVEENKGVEKVSFHPSGIFKMSGKVGKSKSSLDRVTVKGPPLADIIEPRRMMDFILPVNIPSKNKTPGTKDIILQAPSEDIPLRCTVFCMSHSEFDKVCEAVNKDEMRFISNSVFESFHALESETHVWVFVLRASHEDIEFSDRLIIHLAGEPRWGRAWWRRVLFRVCQKIIPTKEIQ